jgi:cytochrome oxidase complex assembly protein 1
MTDQSPPLDRNDMPAELYRWNWGAFLLNWIWGIGNNTFIALLALVPGVGLIVIFVLGAKGNRWAWQNGRWDSVEHFKRVQRAWAKWAVIVYILAAALFAAVFAGAFYALSHSEAYRLAASKLEASAEVANLIGTPITTGWPTGSIKTDGASGSAALDFSVMGPKGAGRAVLEATKQNGLWSLRSLKFKIDGSDRVIDLLNPARADAGDGTVGWVPPSSSFALDKPSLFARQ